VATGACRGSSPKLVQNEGGARRDEGRLVVGPGLEAIDDAHAALLEPRDQAVEVGRLDREMMQPLAALVDEALDEAPRRRALNELELEVPDEEIAPRVVVGVARQPLVQRHGRKVAAEEGERRLHVADGDRDVVHAHAFDVDRVRA
jgi:hypothetical protein